MSSPAHYLLFADFHLPSIDEASQDIGFQRTTGPVQTLWNGRVGILSQLNKYVNLLDVFDWVF
ncbi:MAG: hypothetical protein NPIRA03_36250 [Nitrospirales bacterium]|nr:MAG: hypothetical protein NPIRA03_36250 [Nitrospirales bacterium]